MKNEQMRNEDFAMRETFPNNNTLQNGGKNKKISNIFLAIFGSDVVVLIAKSV